MSSRKAEHRAQFIFFVRKGTALFKQGQTQGALVAFKRALLYACGRDRAMVKAYIRELQQQVPRLTTPRQPLSWQKKAIAILAGILVTEGVLLSVPRVFASVSPPAQRARAVAAVRPKPAHPIPAQETALTRYPHAAIRTEPTSDARLMTLLPQGVPLRILPNNAPSPQWFVRETQEENPEKLWLKVETEDGSAGWMESTSLMDTKKMPLMPGQTLQNGTHLRQAPSLQARVVANLAKGNQVLLLPRPAIMEDELMWFQVKLPNGRTGWMASDYLAGFNGYGMTTLLDSLIAQSVETVFSGQEESYQDHYQQAITHYSTAIAINRTYLNIEDAKVFAHRGNAYKSLGQCNQAMQDFARACRNGHGASCNANCL